MWNEHDKYMRQLKQLYNKTSRQTQLRLQEIFDTFKFTSDNIYDIADNKTKRKIDIYIESWKDKKMLNGYFGMLANNIYRRTRVKNSEILELLIYSAYIEEQNKLEEQEKQIMYEDSNYYYQEGQKEVDKKKKPSIIPMALFLALLDQPNYSGLTWEQYTEVAMQYNAQQIYRQVVLNIQQQKALEIDSGEFQNIIKRQNNQKLNINGDKISGAIDLQTIGLNNLAKVEGMTKAVNGNAQLNNSKDNSGVTITNNDTNDIKVRFIAVEDEVTTKMCRSLDEQIFNVRGWNEFIRYYGNNQKELKLKKFKIRGLVLGVNLPPIMRTLPSL